MAAVLALTAIAVASTLAAAASPPDPPPDPPRGDLRLVVFGDFNGPYGSLAYPPAVAPIVRAVAEVWRPDLLLSPGDVIAGQKASLSDERLAAMWAAFEAAVARPLRDAGIPYAVAMGNHDASSLRDATGRYAFERDRRAAERYWSDPRHGAGLAYLDRDGHPFDYAFRTGEAFVAVIDASSARLHARRLGRLAALLRRPEATSARMRIVVGHLPLAAVARGREGPGEVVRDADELRRILEAGRVDLYVSGHHAAYYPGRLGELELLFAGGVGARPLVVGEARPRSTVTIVDVRYEPYASCYTTLDVATMEAVPASTLPAAIASDLGTIERSPAASPTRSCAASDGRRPR